MNIRLRNLGSNGLAGIARFVFVLVISLLGAHTAGAEIVELSIRGEWSKANFKVKDGSNQFPNASNPIFDGKVFGVDPSSGEVLVKLLVNTDGGVFFAKGSEFNTDGISVYTLSHDFYGYRNVTLVDDIFNFGTAVWKSDGIVSGLEGPDRVKASLWTDVDITKSDPTRVSFRMFGKADGLKADLFVHSLGPHSNGKEFLLWEYYAGEEIRSKKYTIKSKVLNF